MPTPVDQIIKLNSIKVKLPKNAKILEGPINVNHVDSLSSRSHCDYIIKFQFHDQLFYVIIEDTGIPEIKDLDKVDNCYDYFVHGDICIVLKIVHHKGRVNTMVLKLANHKKIDLVRCSKTINVKKLLQKRGYY